MQALQIEKRKPVSLRDYFTLPKLRAPRDGDDGRRTPGQEPVDTPPQPHHAIVQAHLMQAEPRALHHAPAEPPRRPRHTIEADDLLDLKSHGFHFGFQLRL